MTTLPPIAEMNRAVDQRDAGYDGIFLVGHPNHGHLLSAVVSVAEDARTQSQFLRRRCARRCSRATAPASTAGRSTPTANHRIGSNVCWWMSIATPRERLADADLRARKIDPARARALLSRTMA